MTSLYEKKYNKYKLKYIDLCNTNTNAAMSGGYLLQHVTKNICIYDVLSFNQYNINVDHSNKRLVTIIGEEHNYQHTTPVNVGDSPDFPKIQITAAKYIKMVLDKNKKTKSNIFVCLEYDAGIDSTEAYNAISHGLSTMNTPDSDIIRGSINVNDTLEMMYDNNYINLVSGVDLRHSFNDSLGDIYFPTNTTLLFNLLKQIDLLDTILIRLNTLIFVKDRYSNEWDKYLRSVYDEINYKKSLLKNVQKEILQFISTNNLNSSITLDEFYNIIGYTVKTQEEFEKYNFIDQLQNIYMELTDLYILSFCVRKDIYIDELIFIIGENHAQNIYNKIHSLCVYNKYYEQVADTNTDTNTNTNKCIDIKGSIYLQ